LSALFTHAATLHLMCVRRDGANVAALLRLRLQIASDVGNRAGGN
jgi:hypothetical protein